MKETFAWIAATLLFGIFLFVMAWVIGTSQAKADYKKDYERLIMYVRNSFVTLPYYNFIRQKFADIKRYKCRDKKKLSLLEEEFKIRFEKYIELPDEHSPESIYGELV
jgi:hypothetical protein